MYHSTAFWVTFCSSLLMLETVSSFLVFKKPPASSNVTKLSSLRFNKKAKIINGKPVSVDQFPTSVIFFNSDSMCAGTILNSWTVLTAAHCFEPNVDPFYMLIQAGSTQTISDDGDMYEVLYFDVHPEYNHVTEFDCDIAVIFLIRPIKLGPTAQKALIVTSEQWKNSTFMPEFVVTGWGMIEENGRISQGLMMTTLTLVPNRKCQAMHDDAPITDYMLCLYGGGLTDTCRGDSGGGVMWRGQLVGVVSHGDGCAHYNKPSIYTNVYSFVNWIRSRINTFNKLYCYSHGFTLDIK